MSFGTAIPIPTGYDPAADAQTMLSTASSNRWPTSSLP